MITITGYFLLLLSGCSMSASNRRCLPLHEEDSFCFTQPDPPVNLSWSSAMQWCKDIGATLPIVNNSYQFEVYQNALGYFGLQAETLWMGANSTYDPDNWFWMDGTRFIGNIELSNSTNQIHMYAMRNGSVLKFGATNQFETNYWYYICRSAYSEVNCANSPDTVWTNGKCYRKYTIYWPSDWYSFVSNCEQSYEDLMEMTRWLDNEVKFWIGVRCGWWTWHDMVTGRSFEIIQNRYGAGVNLPNIDYGECLAYYKDSSNVMYGSTIWINLNCSRTLQFVCQEHVNQTGLTQKTTTGSLHYGLPNQTPRWRLPGLSIGLGVGLGGGLLLAIGLVLLFVHAYGRNCAARYSPVDPRRRSDNNPYVTSRNAFDNYMFSASSGTLDRTSSRNPYEPVNLKANEHVY